MLVLFVTISGGGGGGSDNGAYLGTKVFYQRTAQQVAALYSDRFREYLTYYSIIILWNYGVFFDILRENSRVSDWPE